MPVNLSPFDYNIITGERHTPDEVCERILTMLQSMPNATFSRIDKYVHTIDIKRIRAEENPRLWKWATNAIGWIQDNVPMSKEVIFTATLDLWIVHPLKKPGLVVMVAVNVSDPPTRLVIMPPDSLMGS